MEGMTLMIKLSHIEKTYDSPSGPVKALKGIDLEKMKLSLPFRVFLDAASLALLLFLTYFSGSSFRWPSRS